METPKIRLAGLCYEYSGRENVGQSWHPAVLEIKRKAGTGSLKVFCLAHKIPKYGENTTYSPVITSFPKEVLNPELKWSNLKKIPT